MKQITIELDKAIQECNCSPRYIVLSKKKYKELMGAVLFFTPVSYMEAVILINPTADIDIDVL